MAAKQPKQWPPLECPDCGGAMPLVPKPASWSGKSRLVYRCNDPFCDGLMSARANGAPEGIPAPREVRQARKHCHAVFDPLWREAHRMACYAGSEKTPKTYAIIGKTARRRAYRYMAWRLDIPEADCHLSRMLDIALLRQFYKTARNTTAEQIRAWAMERRDGDDRGEAMAPMARDSDRPGDGDDRRAPGAAEAGTDQRSPER